VWRIFRSIGKGFGALKSIRHFENWGAFLLDRFGLRQGNYILRTRDGLRFKLRSGTKDCAIIQEVLLENCYWPDPEYQIRDGDTILDVGAHAGVFSVSAARRAGKGRVLALEPCPMNFDLLVENSELNQVRNLRPIPLGLAGSSGSRTLYVDSKNCGGHSILPGGGGGTVSIKTSTLEEFLRDEGVSRVDFMKVDCEGAEYEILTSASKSVLAAVDRIVLEYHGSRESRESVLENHLTACGFSVRKSPVSTELGILYATRPEANAAHA
jgi:FkbM family methyltransferase